MKRFLLATSILAAQVQPPDPAFNRLYDYPQVEAFLKQYAAAYPATTKLQSLGKSTQGRDMWLITLNNPKTGAPENKPALYVDANIHGNEVQGTETALYLLNYLLKQYGRLKPVTELMDRAVIHIVPMVNPDGRAKWFKGPSTSSSWRGTMFPWDEDRDGHRDEDGPEDLNADGIIGPMRKKVPLGLGTHRLDPQDSRRLVFVGPGESGDWVLLGQEGQDHDGDGQMGEDGPGGNDPNRSWGYSWAPRHIQSGATHYPLEIPETRAIATWAQQNLNISAFFSYHNTGQMILRGPGSKSEPAHSPEDERVESALGEMGEKLLPGYKSMVTYKDLYTVYGGTTEHFYGVLGALGFVLELYGGPVQDLDKDGKVSDEERYRWDKLLTQGRQIHEWTPFKHPLYGDLEIGGNAKDTSRMPEGWMLEEECHRATAFVLYTASQMPKLSVLEPTVRKVGDQLWRVEVPVRNEGQIPSLTSIVMRNKLHRQDLASLEGAHIVASGLQQRPVLDAVNFQAHRPERLQVPGIPGNGHRTLVFLTDTPGRFTFRYDSLKGGKLSREIVVK